MGYGYAETFLIVFLTHPGVIIPTVGSAINKAMSYVPEDVSSNIPPEATDMIKSIGVPPAISGLWQVLWVWILSLPGEKSPAFGWTMYALYLVFLLIYMYFFLRIRMSQGI
jgi:hypothetical protein